MRWNKTLKQIIEQEFNNYLCLHMVSTFSADRLHSETTT